ncbi:carboxylate-amine ligase [Amycolatopsis regifaucium]|uniref:Putative glutamate--cysteine ligase 2 n=1 Tax=Amycolatopsis regifaucium TaxID=546365 RepID=A0A154M4G9_9PSEU|nr:glutamate--cysteine ligase [Amycolatopsis regifaucium]KZB79320.1 carboxylate--amine ligase [Amycolatopsis regifaucium]OKA07503.1 carboxylate--amine ligase [Amycolatopsis regifaucium]SFH09889.1 carboxylate-amine ligase [Amycolatopsis regifaucium]
MTGIGVEEEFLLVDPRTGVSCPRAEAVVARQQACCPLPDGAAVHRELRPTQIEAATGVCETSEELYHHLVAGRRSLAEAAAAEDCAIIASGTALRGPPDREPQADDDRFGKVDDLYAGVVRSYEACGCHVHIGVPDRDTAVAVVNHLAEWLPTLLALSGNSPFDGGRDSGYASWRMVEQSRFPGSGIAPHFAGIEDYEIQVDRLVDCGVLVDAKQTFWLARPSPSWPTVEVRAADTASTVDEAVLQALLTRALVRTALDALDKGVEAEPLDPQIAAAAVWSAARYGLSGPAIDPIAGKPVPAAGRLASLREHTRSALAETGDLALVNTLLNQLENEGTGAERQRRAAADGDIAVLRMLTEETVPHG